MSKVWVFDNLGRRISIKLDDKGVYWITGSGIGDVYVPLLEMLRGLHGKRKVLQLEAQLARLKTGEDITGYLKHELGNLGYTLVEQFEVSP